MLLYSRTPAHGVLTRINDTAYSITGLDYNTTYNIIVFATSDITGGEYVANITVSTVSLQSMYLNKYTDIIILLLYADRLCT